MRMDPVDIKILGILQRDGRLSNLELADMVALSPSACHRRVKLLEENGYIDGYHATLNAKKLGFDIQALVNLNIGQLSEAQHNYFTREIGLMPEVVSAYIVTGETNYVLHVRTRNFEEFSRFVVNRLNKLKGVTKIYSQIVLDELKSLGARVPL
ncbi:Lrp/AsnC family transcriptional regulator [Castellaniella defragrans]|uniref:DNA-binding Lrp family transcriptional regulator n=1 Tax=Castellaniella defragrans TaxID=75697 RepID=A0A7W9WPX2_CASDE|nr:Lrp/AsnC family transcriptional regulator [Castellaniella defragrans]KAB0622128.1 Lrp/AsnC family transcriptional regulator [Castellaniella defragrans]MBB6085326.1 DNA-binding Lrp family transcriptional regulator [Castellaniella defragrans]